MHDQTSKIRVLVVDDERIIADSLAMILNQTGYFARAAYSGLDAIRIAREWEPAALISDVVMPGIDGIESTLEILRILPHCRAILISGHGTVGDIARSHLEILPKPVHPKLLLQKLADVETSLRDTSNRIPMILGPEEA